MVTGFENQTHELNQEERIYVLPAVKSILSTKIGKENSITSKRLIELLKAVDVKTSGPRIRKVVHEIRVKGLVQNLLASSKGYYVSNDKNEIGVYLNSLLQRENSIKEVRNALIKQAKQ